MIAINDQIFPSELSRINELKSLIRNRELTINEKFEVHRELIGMISPKAGAELNHFGFLQSPDELSRLNGNLSWYALNVSENEIAVQAAM